MVEKVYLHQLWGFVHRALETRSPSTSSLSCRAPVLRFALCDVQEVQHLIRLVQDDISPQRIVQQTLLDLPALSRQLILSWSDRVLTS